MSQHEQWSIGLLAPHNYWKPETGDINALCKDISNSHCLITLMTTINQIFHIFCHLFGQILSMCTQKKLNTFKKFAVTLVCRIDLKYKMKFGLLQGKLFWHFNSLLPSNLVVIKEVFLNRNHESTLMDMITENICTFIDRVPHFYL